MPTTPATTHPLPARPEPRRCPGFGTMLLAGVVVFVARVRVEVFGRAELCRVDEQRHDDGCALLACGAHQRQMAFVEPAHRWDQADGSRRDGERATQLGDGADRLHAATSRVC